MQAKEVFKRSYVLITKKKGKSKVLSRGFRLLSQNPSRRHYNCRVFAARLKLNNYRAAPESNIQNRRGRTLDLPFFFHYKYVTALKTHFSLAPGESLPYWFGATLRPCLL